MCRISRNPAFCIVWRCLEERRNSMLNVNIEETGFSVDADGYLLDFDEWNENVAAVLAEREGVGPLSEQQVEILRFIREHYRKFNFFPIVHSVCTNLDKPAGCLRELFVNPLAAWKVAGLPKADETVINLLKYGQSPG